MRAVSLIEPLEDRIAPAAVTIAANGKTASYKDTAGDTILITTTKGTFTSGQFIFDPSAPGQLTELLLTGHSDFTGANITFSITPVNGGSATVNVGYIDALGLNLGTVTLPGDLGRIDVGGGATAAAITKLAVNSLGVQGSATQGGLTESTISNITGTAGTISVAGDIDGAISVADYNGHPGTGNISLLSIGGSLDGATSSGLGEVFFTGSLGSAVIGGGIEGGSAAGSGSIAGTYGTLAKIGSVTVKGSVPDDPNPNPDPSLPGTSILGGSGLLSGGISAVTVGGIFVAGDVFGGTGIASGDIQAGQSLGTVTIEGSLIGGNFSTGNPSQANSAGAVFGGTIGTVTIGKSIFGGSGLNSGEILSAGSIQKVLVMGDLVGGSAGVAAFAGSDSQAATASVAGNSGVIKAQTAGSITVEGSVIGGTRGFQVDANGTPVQTADTSGAIVVGSATSITIAKTLVGGGGPSSGIISSVTGGIGTISIGGASGSSVQGGSGALSGVVSVAGNVGHLTLAHDLTGGSGINAGLLSVNGGIASLVIGGNVTGGSENNTGTISVFGTLSSATIKGGITGSSSGSTLLTNTGYVQAAGIGSMTVGGALTAGTAGSGGLDTSGAIRSTAAIGSLTIGGLAGNATNPAIISAVGPANLAANATTDVAIGTLTVKGNAVYADILAGYNPETAGGTQPAGTGVNADAQIGTVQILKVLQGGVLTGGNLIATNIIAGVGAGANGFGTAGSAALSGVGVSDLSSIVSKISKVIVQGAVESGSAGSFGIAAQYIVSASVGGKALVLVAGADNDTFAAGKDQILSAAPGTEVLYEV